jgi:hypothetical protein
METDFETDVLLKLVDLALSLSGVIDEQFCMRRQSGQDDCLSSTTTG